MGRNPTLLRAYSTQTLMRMRRRRFPLIPIVIISLSVLHLIFGQPCSQSDPIEWAYLLISPERRMVQCTRYEIATRARTAADSATTRSRKNLEEEEIEEQWEKAVPPALMARLRERGLDGKGEQLFAKYGNLLPKDRRITLEDLRALPKEIQDLCDDECRKEVKQYIRN